QVRGHRPGHLPDRKVDRADERARDERGQEEDHCGEPPEPRAGAAAAAGLLRHRFPDCDLGRLGHLPRSARATARTKSTIRGPHREATESSTTTIWPRCTAFTRLQPGRAATAALLCPQQRVSEHK